MRLEGEQRFMHTLRPLANGLRTDHPVPDLPFVDDSHLPLDDPEAFEAVGRHAGTGMWGRWDKERVSGGWRGFTTDPIRQDLAWCVRDHPEHGRSVLLVHDDDAALMHSHLHRGPLLYRAGAYWWDGSTWYRPTQIWDAASEDYLHTPVKSAVTVTVADLLDDQADPGAGQVLKVANFDTDAPAPRQWLEHLARWAKYRADHGGTLLPLTRCVVKFSAPELAGDQLIGVAEMAELGGIAASTLRAYISRGEGDVPLPQATVSGRSAWSRPVAQDWAEARRRSTDSVVATLATGETSNAPGVKDLWERYSQIFHSELFSRPDTRKRWAIRWRGEDEVRKVADQLGWIVAADLDHIIPTSALATTVEHAVIHDLAMQQDTRSRKDREFYVLEHDIAKMLDWLIRHHPDHGHYTIGGIVREAEQRLGIPRDRIAQCLLTSLSMDGELTADQLRDYLDLALPPAKPIQEQA
jgi:hypothetical protein